jgi:hypothetical protein
MEQHTINNNPDEKKTPLEQYKKRRLNGMLEHTSQAR